MDKFFRQKAIAAALFLICLFTLSFLNIRSAWKPLLYSLSAFWENGSLRSYTAGLESVINEGIYKKQSFIDAFGYLQLLMYKSEQSDFETVKDSRGMLHEAGFAGEPDSTLALARSLRRLQDNIADIPIVYVMPPDKHIRDFTAFPTGIPHSYANETADSFLRMLSLYNIDAVDLREGISESGIPPEELFYKTDSRWTTQASFWAFTELAEQLREGYGISFDEGRFLFDSGNYNMITYPSCYLGGLGARTGRYYAGVDDFTVIYPKFDTDYTVRMGYGELGEYTANGRFEEALLSSEAFLRSEAADYALSDKYSSYLLAGRGIAHIKNNLNPDGPKIAFLSDSMMAPAASFLSVACADVYMIDPVFFSGDIYEVLKNPELDIIIVAFRPQSLKQAYFPF